MTKSTSNARLSDVQLLLLSAAINRPDGSLLPPSAALGGELSERIRKAITALIRRGLAEERETSQADQIWREEGDRRIGLVITDAGRSAIAADGGARGPDEAPTAILAAALPTPAKNDNASIPNLAPELDSAASTDSPVDPKAESKIASVITLLERPEGATLLDLVDATDWLPHTIRAAMTGLRHKGYAIERSSRENTTFWYIAAGAGA